MWEFAMAHEVISLIVVLGTVWAVERMVTAFINRNKPSVQCGCENCTDDEEEEDEEEE